MNQIIVIAACPKVRSAIKLSLCKVCQHHQGIHNYELDAAKEKFDKAQEHLLKMHEQHKMDRVRFEQEMELATTQYEEVSVEAEQLNRAMVKCNFPVEIDLARVTLEL